MTNADVTEINLGVMLCKNCAWVEMLYNTFVSLTACMKVEMLKSSLHQSRYDNILNNCRAENES